MNENDRSVLTEVVSGKGIITLNRPRKLNAMNREMLLLLSDTLDEMIADKNVRVIVITGAGEKAFCAGGDINEELALDVFGAYEWSRLGHSIFAKIESSPKPVIAAINGYCLGGAFEMITACGYPMDADYFTEHVFKNVIKGNYDYYPSMAQDVLIYNRSTEIDALNGKISELGEKHGIPTPANDIITLIVKCKQDNYDKIYPKG